MRLDGRGDALTDAAVDGKHVHEDSGNLRGDKRVARARQGRTVRLQDGHQAAQRVDVLEDAGVGHGGGNDGVPRLVRHEHQNADPGVRLSLHRVGLDHASNGLVKDVHLMRVQIAQDGAHAAQNVVDERLAFPGLDHDKLATALFRNLDERVAGHVLDALVAFVHKLKQLVHHRLHELPVRL